MNNTSPFSVSLFSKPGGRTTNEDAALFLLHPDDESLLICALADGQGGRPGGEAAANLACKATIEKACTYSPRQLAKPKTWIKILSEADSAVCAAPDAGATTLVGLCIANRVGTRAGTRAICGASSGDSAAVLLNVYDRYHELTAGQSKNPPVGSGQATFVPFSAQLLDPWLVMLASDGLWKYVGWDAVKKIMQAHQMDRLPKIDTAEKTGEKIERLSNALAHAARTAGQGILRDDTTMILVEPASFSDGAAHQK